jgi:hypothetical protein
MRWIHVFCPFATRHSRRLSVRALIPMLVIAIGVVSFSGCQTVRDAEDELDLALEQIDEIQARVDDRELYELTPDDLVWLEDEFVILADRVENMQGMSSLPLGLDSVAERGSARYRAIMDTLEMAQAMSEAGIIIASIGYDAMIALDDTGVRPADGDDGDTWLDVLQDRQNELETALELIDEALEKREEIDEDELPGRVQAKLDTIDDLTERFSAQLELADDLPLAFEALGADEPQRYFVLFQNPAELRPTGGFVGTVAELEFHRGQVSLYEFHDVYELSLDYQAQSEHSVEPPWAIREYVRPDNLQVQDANWWADFPDSAQLLMDMTEAAGWEPFDGVVAMQPEVVQDLISITGAIEVEVDGEAREITADNVYEESERQRRMLREGGESETDHKEVIELIGDVLLDEVMNGGRDELVAAALIGIENLDRRDVQVFHEHDGVREFIEGRNWAGRMVPDSDIPTVGVIYANITGLKTSLTMQPEFELTIDKGADSDSIDASLVLTMNHLGSAENDPFYEGFQRWWVDVTLPDGATDIVSSEEFAGDPDASSGGAYIVRLDVGEQKEITIDFRIPATEQLLIRRQPGLVTVQGSVTTVGCAENLQVEVSTDQVLLLGDDCAALEEPNGESN